MPAGKKGGGFGSLFMKPPEEREATTPAAPRNQPAPEPSEREPELISSLVPGADSAPAPPKRVSASPAAAASASSKRIADLVAEAQKSVPADNATMKLVLAMASLESVIPDTGVRKEAALKVLASQGISAEDVERGAKEVERAINTRLDVLLRDAETVRERNVASRRTQAQGLRSQASELERRIAELESERSALTNQASELDVQASASEADLDAFKTDLEAARAAACAAYGA
jgi:hypothetical protein